MRLRELQQHAVRLGFTPQDQVRWLSPQELARTAIKVGLSTLLTDYTDRREAQAAFPSTRIEILPDDRDEVWIDFLADLGDGFNSTYTVARMLAEPELSVLPPSSTGGESTTLPRAQLLVMGGDEVYPTPSAWAYENRLKGPYRAALGGPERGAPAGDGLSENGGLLEEHGGCEPVDLSCPVMVALPGNHDWYDGLTAFLRMFTQQRRIGGWRTAQSRSYFAVRLPHRWWLVGLDTQLGTYIDEPQIQFFREHLSAELQPGDAVIVCAPAPTWVRTGEGDPDAFNSLQYFERDVVRRFCREDGSSTETGAQVRLWITGDYHHYARYAEELPADGTEGAGKQLVSCGIGGAYLLDTHELPTELRLPHPESRMAQDGPTHRFRLAGRWPSAKLSRRLVRGMFGGPPRGLPFRNPGLWPAVGVGQAVLMLSLAWVLGQGNGLKPSAVLRELTAGDVVSMAGQLAVWLVVAILIGSFVPLLRWRSPRWPPEWVLASVAQLTVALAGLAVVVSIPWGQGLPDWAVLGASMLFGGVVFGFLGCYAIGVSIALSRSRMVRGWQMSAQSIEDYKGFVRMRIDPNGRLTLFPVAVDRVCRDWDLAGGREPGTARPVPAGEPPVPHLIEAPIVIDRVGR
jgi:hypothetical protein